MVSTPRLPSLGGRLAKLERKIRALEKRKTIGRASLSPGDNITVIGGQLRVYDTLGNLIGFLGTTAGGETGFFVQRADGTSSFYAWTSGGGFAAMFDRASNYVVTDDATSGQGLARPYVPLGSFVDNSAPTRSTMSTSWTTLQTLSGYKQHPKITMQVLVQTGTGTTGDVRVVDQNGVQVGATQSIAAAALEYRTIQGALAGAHMLGVSLNLQARVTSGVGAIGVRGGAAWGVESAAF